MRFLFLLLTTTLLLQTAAQKSGDTLFVGPNTNSGNQQLIFIAPPHSAYHNRVFELLLPAPGKNDGTEVPLANAKQDAGNRSAKFEGQWITVSRWRESFFAYAPSEPFYNTLLVISNTSVTLNDFNEGFVSYPLSRKKEKRKKAVFELSGPGGSKHRLTIKQSAGQVFEIRSSLFSTGRLYFVRRSDYNSFPIIVNHCPERRCGEFEFR